MAEPAKNTQTGTPAVAKQESALVVMKRTVVDAVGERALSMVRDGKMHLPANYSVENAITGAWLTLQSTVDRNNKPVLDVCTKDSISHALFDMIVQGLNPTKKQVYFIAYGNSLACQPSYFGHMAIAKMVQPKVDDFAYAVVYEGDTFKYGIKNGKKTVTEHEQDIDNVKKSEIKAAYCIALDKNGEPFRTDIMTIDEIKQAWKQSKMNPVDADGKINAGSTHGKFTADMALKTVINRLCKPIIDGSDDSSLLADTLKRGRDLADRTAADMAIEDEANRGSVIDITSKEKIVSIPQDVETRDDIETDTGAQERQQEEIEQRKPGF